MTVKIRLARAGAKKRPYYRIVVANSDAPRDGKFLEKVGTYDPMLAKEDVKRVVLNQERIKHWLSVGAQPTERVTKFLEKSEIVKKKAAVKRVITSKVAASESAEKTL
jgi:small subunit ribosomal protein S16